MGDAIVLRIVNRFPSAVCDEIGVALTTKIGQELQEIENIEPVSDIPLYVRWLAEESLTIEKHRNAIYKVWGGNANIVPVVANGKVYVASYKALTIFGRGAPAAQKALRPTPVASLPSPHVITGTLQPVFGQVPAGEEKS